MRGVPGWMLPEDGLKLYELAYFAPGPILEIGAYHGKSAILMCNAARDGGTGATVLSVDVDGHALDAARAQAARHGVTDGIVFFRGSVEALLRTASGLRPGLVFIDGDHSHAGVLRDLEALEPRLPDGALLLFHDYFQHPRDVCAGCRCRDLGARRLRVRRCLRKLWAVRAPSRRSGDRAGPAGARPAQPRHTAHALPAAGPAPARARRAPAPSEAGVG